MAPARPPYKIALAGLGTVGAAVAAQILENPDRFEKACGRSLEIAAVCARDKTKKRGFILPGSVQWYDDPAVMAAQSGADCTVELMGGKGEAVSATFSAALAAGKAIVTANKAYLADNLTLLNHPLIRFEAAVAGGIPVIEALRTGLRGNTIRKITAILNGTCNYILTELEKEPVAFDAIVKKAQDAGYAEADPTLDISGADTAQKAMILSYLAFGAAPHYDSIKRAELNGETPQYVKQAQAGHEVIRLVAEIEQKQSGITIDVAQKRFKRTDDFAFVTAAQNAVLIEADPVNTLFLKGYGAGGKPTASAVLADICAHALRLE